MSGSHRNIPLGVWGDGRVFSEKFLKREEPPPRMCVAPLHNVGSGNEGNVGSGNGGKASCTPAFIFPAFLPDRHTLSPRHTDTPLPHMKKTNPALNGLCRAFCESREKGMAHLL